MKEIITLATSESIIYVTIEKNLECPDMSNGGWGSFHPPLKLSNFDLRCLIIIHKASQDKAMAQ